MMPWFPAPKMVWRLWNGMQIYRTLRSIILERQQTGRREDDSVQMFIDDNDPVAAICRVVMDSTVASAHNTAIMIPWLQVYLGTNKEWADKLRREAMQALDACSPNSELDENASPLKRFSHLTYQDWETRFPLHDLAWKETIRMQLIGTMFRRNTSGQTLHFGNTTIPNGAFVVHHINDTEIVGPAFENPEQFDPSRFSPDRQSKPEERKKYAFMGYGAGVHPCGEFRQSSIRICTNKRRSWCTSCPASKRDCDLYVFGDVQP